MAMYTVSRKYVVLIRSRMNRTEKPQLVAECDTFHDATTAVEKYVKGRPKAWLADNSRKGFYYDVGRQQMMNIFIKRKRSLSHGEENRLGKRAT